LVVTQGDSAPSNALYLVDLGLLGFTNDYLSVDDMVTNLLFAPVGVNVYYEANASDAWLNDLTYQLYSGPGGGTGGFLIPAIPEPSTVVLWVVGGGLLVWWRRRRG